MDTRFRKLGLTAAVAFLTLGLSGCELKVAGDNTVDDGSNSKPDNTVVDTDNDGVTDDLDAFPNDPDESKDSDEDGVGDEADKFPNNPDESKDSDGDGVGDNEQNGNAKPTDKDGDGVLDANDAFPSDPAESKDSDGDGVGDNADAFPNNPTESKDSDGDGVGDISDAFPNDATESKDTDGNGVGDNEQNTNSTPTDADGDGVADANDAFPSNPNESKDSDGDGVGDNADKFPNNPNESKDSDGDGVGDIADKFPNNSNESKDSDGDGVGDNADKFPDNSSESQDSDGDGVGDNADKFPNNSSESQDSDGDGVGDNADAFPNDATKSEAEDGTDPGTDPVTPPVTPPSNENEEQAQEVVDDEAYEEQGDTIPLDEKAEGVVGASLQTEGNPFDEAHFYVNPDITTMMKYSLDIALDDGDEELAKKIRYVQHQPSAVWMDSIAAISGDKDAGRRSLVEHLDAALAQQNHYASKNNNTRAPMTIVVIVYNLPDRDCAAYASAGKLLQVGDPRDSSSNPSNGFQVYEQQYITPIAKAIGDPKYSTLRIVTMLEPDSFPNMITNTNDPTANQNGITPNSNFGNPKASLPSGGYCDHISRDTTHGFTVQGEGTSANPHLGVYAAGLRLAIRDFAEFDNVYTYLDIAHSGWLGWDEESDNNSNMKRGVRYFKQLVDGADGVLDGKGFDMIRGFASNTSNNTPLEEPMISSATADRMAMADYYEWNSSVDEITYLDRLNNYFTTSNSNWGEGKFDPNKFGFIVDTARNGWGRDGRPTLAQSDKGTDLSKRVDLRAHRGHWCNVDKAGIGEVPKASPDSSRPHLDAFFWMKPPGESDGISFDVNSISDADYANLDQVDKDIVDQAGLPVYEGKDLDTMCITGEIRDGKPVVTIPEMAPHAGAWFHKQFIMLIDNAYPALGESEYSKN